MSNGGKGGKTTETKIDPELEKYSRDLLNLGAAAASIPFLPNQGGMVAAMTSPEKAAAKGVNRQAAAFGLPTADLQDLPDEVNAGGGIKAYSTAPVYKNMKDASVSKDMQRNIDKLFAPLEGVGYDLLARRNSSDLLTTPSIYSGGSKGGEVKKKKKSKREEKGYVDGANRNK